MMNEKRFKLSDWCGEQSVSNVIDIEKQTHLTNIEVLDSLNEQQATINNQEQRIKILQQEINDTQAILEMLVEKLKGWNDE